jgi:alpha-L-rhamnosidase
MPDELPAKSSACQNECQEPARWFTQSLCGVMPDREAPAFKHVLLRPRIPSRLPSASLVTTTAYGTLESSWTQKAGMVNWTVCIPANSYATALIPARMDQIDDGSVPLEKSQGCSIEKVDASGVECRLGSGAYSFRFPAPSNEPSRLN